MESEGSKEKPEPGMISRLTTLLCRFSGDYINIKIKIIILCCNPSFVWKIHLLMPSILKPRYWRTCIIVWTWSCPMWPWCCWSPGPWASLCRLSNSFQGPPLPGGRQNSYQLRPWRQLFKNHNFVFFIIEFLQGPLWHRIVGSKGKIVDCSLEQYGPI